MQMNIVDTPGTNVILERQQRLTEEFVPRADLLLFVISADRPLTESEVLTIDINSLSQRLATNYELMSCLVSYKDHVVVAYHSYSKSKKHGEDAAW